jgi:hypothetical protein
VGAPAGLDFDLWAGPAPAEVPIRKKLSLESFEAHLAANGVDFAATKLTLGRTLTIDPTTETSADPEANRLFTREYRKGYELPRA